MSAASTSRATPPPTRSTSLVAAIRLSGRRTYLNPKEAKCGWSIRATV
jgi:hypothetical protein